MARTAAQIALILALSGCGPHRDEAPIGPQVLRGEMRFGLSFEERMAIPPQLSRLRAEALRQANQVYDPFRSRDDAARNDEYQAQLITESRSSLLAEKKLSEADLAAIIAEYQASLGAELRR